LKLEVEEPAKAWVRARVPAPAPAKVMAQEQEMEQVPERAQVPVKALGPARELALVPVPERALAQQQRRDHCCRHRPQQSIRRWPRRKAERRNCAWLQERPKPLR
jgi:hypothetical protein